MSKVGRYAAILKKSKHIQHDFDSFEQAAGWMESTKESGSIAIIVGEVSFNPLLEVSDKSKELVAYATKIGITEKDQS